MSEQAQGPGWWEATDGKWYPPATPEPPPPATDSPQRRRRWWLTLLVVIGVLAVIGAFMPEPGPSEEDQAFEACQRSITARLKAPATAKWTEPAFREEGADSFAVLVVTGAVDSENSFGAMLRSTYTCTVRDIGERAEIVDLQLR